MRIKLFSNKVNTESSLRQFLYLVVVGVETLDDVDAEEDVDTELEVEALKTHHVNVFTYLTKFIQYGNEDRWYLWDYYYLRLLL